MTQGLTPSEKFVAALCQRAFLKLWTHPNPIGKKNKELCDCLIVCGPHVVIFSVKDIEFKDTGDKTGWDRWQRSAIDKSVQQIWGAERCLQKMDVVESRGGRSVTLPQHNVRKYHRISISLGAQGKVPIRWGDLGHGFVHVFDEHNFQLPLSELDTITDFVSYLVACENLITKGIQPLFNGGGVEDLLALYVRHGNSFGLPDEAIAEKCMMVVGDGIWNQLVISPEYKAQKTELANSYTWDRLISIYSDDLLSGGMFDMYDNKVTTNELALIGMALQPRSYRATLAEAFVDFLDPVKKTTASRVVIADQATAFVFLAGDSSDREYRVRELGLRCFVVRAKCPFIHTVIGIATDRWRGTKGGYSSDLAYLYFHELSQEQITQASRIQTELGYFKNAVWSENAEA